jgi:hypothetical protein
MCCGETVNEQKKKWHTAARYFALPFSWRGSQTPPDTSSMYSTPRYCRAMPLHVMMEEERRAKAANVSGLKYCVYN